MGRSPDVPRAGAEGNQKVSTVELFFDLVFVYLITQLTHLVGYAHGAQDLLLAPVALVLLWWLYAACVWLVSALGAGARLRFVLILAMTGFLLMAVALPRINTDGARVFALAYAAVVALHTSVFALAGDAQHKRAIFAMVPFNFGSMALVLGAGWASSEFRLPLLIAAALWLLASALRRTERGFLLQAEHFAERHGLLILIVFGESIVAIGSGAQDLAFGSAMLGSSALGIILISALWWSYFTGDDEAAQHALGKASAAQRERLGAVYWLTHLMLIAGVVMLSAGIRQVIAQAGSVAGAATLLGLGTSLFLVGDLAFRYAMGIGWSSPRAVVAIAAFGSVFLSSWLDRVAHLGLLAFMLVCMLLSEQIAHHKTRQLARSSVT